jgi:hypothetical protein
MCFSIACGGNGNDSNPCNSSLNDTSGLGEVRKLELVVHSGFTLAQDAYNAKLIVDKENNTISLRVSSGQPIDIQPVIHPQLIGDLSIFPAAALAATSIEPAYLRDCQLTGTLTAHEEEILDQQITQTMLYAYSNENVVVDQNIHHMIINDDRTIALGPYVDLQAVEEIVSTNKAEFLRILKRMAQQLDVQQCSSRVFEKLFEFLEPNKLPISCVIGQ